MHTHARLNYLWFDSCSSPMLENACMPLGKLAHRWQQWVVVGAVIVVVSRVVNMNIYPYHHAAARDNDQNKYWAVQIHRLRLFDKDINNQLSSSIYWPLSLKRTLTLEIEKAKKEEKTGFTNQASTTEWTHTKLHNSSSIIGLGWLRSSCDYSKLRIPHISLYIKWHYPLEMD